MRYRLRTLLILLALLPPALAVGYRRWAEYRAAQARLTDVRITRLGFRQIPAPEPVRNGVHDVFYEANATAVLDGHTDTD